MPLDLASPEVLPISQKNTNNNNNQNKKKHRTNKKEETLISKLNLGRPSSSPRN